MVQRLYLSRRHVNLLGSDTGTATSGVAVELCGNFVEHAAHA